jgi:hypothetical protein
MATKTPGRVRAREAICIVIGARPVEWHKRIVRNRRTGKLAEIDVHELGPKVPEEPGIPYVFARGEEVDSDHVAILAKPHAFVPVE